MTLFANSISERIDVTSNVGGGGGVVNDFRQAKAGYFFVHLTFVGWNKWIRNDQS